MRHAMVFRKVAVVCLIMALVFATGCRAFGLQDWQRDLIGLSISTGVGFLTNALLLPFQYTVVRVERNCFENGVPIDCALLPNNGEI